MEKFKAEYKNKVVRGAKRATYDKAEVYDILDSGFICHISFVMNGEPFIIPTAYARKGDLIYIHGSFKSRMINSVKQDIPISLCVTHLDGLVLARSAFHHSFNYRSAIIYGAAVELDDKDEKNEALRLITEGILKGRWDEVRQPNEKELAITSVLAIKIESASAKIRKGAPVDDKEDYELDIWAGELPLTLNYGKPITDSASKGDFDVSNSVKSVLEE